MPTLLGRNISIQEAQMLWAVLYHNRQTQLGATATLVNFGDQPNAGKVNAATFTGAQFSATGLAPVWTPNVALSARATPFDLTLVSNWQGIIPTLAFNGTSERMTTPDALYWTRALTAASWGAWVYGGGTGATLMAKGTTGGLEWSFTLGGNDIPLIRLYDEDDAATPNGYIQTLADAAIAANAWHLVVATYDGTANASGLDIYVDGALVASTDTDQAGFASSRDYTAVVEVGAEDAANYHNSRIAGGPCCPFFVQVQLTVAQILNMYRLERLAFSV